MQGKIACANVLSDLYATGVYECDNMLMLQGISIDLILKEREIVTKLMIEGFRDLAKEAGTSINGGQTVKNPWIIVGGVATSVVKENEFIMPDGAMEGDVIVLTKPLGTQIAVNAHQWIENPERWSKISDIVTVEDVEKAYMKAMFSMARLNKTAAQLMHKYNAHAATDVTGFGILGHATNLVEHQKNEVDFEIEKLPIIKHMTDVYKLCGINFKLLDGYSSETSGGLLICLSKQNAEEFCKEIEMLDGQPAWIIGKVTKGVRKAFISENVEIFDS